MVSNKKINCDKLLEDYEKLDKIANDKIVELFMICVVYAIKSIDKGIRQLPIN